jgi:hypothetical protein
MLSRGLAIRLYRLCRFALATACVCAGQVGFAPPANTSAFAAEPIAVALTSGRIFAGEVDSRTDSAQLWLRLTQPGMEVCRPIAWENIVLAERGNRQLSPAELRAQVDELKSSTESAETLGEATVTEELPSPKPSSWNPDLRLSQYIQAARENNTQVNSLSIDAHVGQWSRTVQANGIVVHVYPLDCQGRVIPVDGTLDVDLIAQVSPGAPLGTSLPRIGRWTVRVTPDQFGPAGAVVKLPFQGVQPEFDVHVGPYGLVHATLNVPGSGSFETSQAMLRIRPYSVVRDEEQQITGTRFFDVERVDRWAP